jgi:2-C-methyl-D-erythritol 4-phosphate cytidylyltransferase
MWVIVNENGIKYTISHVYNHVEVLAQSKDGSIITQGRTRKEAVRKAYRELKKMADESPIQ